MIGVLLIATGGPRYTRFVPDLIKSLKRFFPPHEIVLFTDETFLPWNILYPSRESRMASGIVDALSNVFRCPGSFEKI